MAGFVEWGLELIRRTTSDLSPDVEAAIRAARDREDEGTTARNVMDVIVRNVELARSGGTPICQDTGLVGFFVHVPRGTDTEGIRADLVEAVRRATKEGLLRSNAVDPLTGRNSGDNVGAGLPYVAFDFDDASEAGPGEAVVTVDLMLKGGGSENVGAQYRLPDATLKAGRDVRGVEKCVLDAIHKAQGFGCAPGIIGVCVGGDRAGSYAGAKKQLLRPLDDRNPDPDLAGLEERLLPALNELGVGPMGFGGKTTVLAVKAGKLHRHPASFFVSIAYCCWADRRRRLVVRDGVAELV